ncbi:MAG: nuclear transport factor 2 family protein [Deltaproteobacteria bacterium]|nr:nuclear transport factor 2 family protein [Deltaproteobacteria bacterium]
MSDKQLFHKFFDVFNHRDTKEMGDLLSPDAEFYFPKTQPLIGRERILKFLNILFRQYPELAFKIQRVIHQGDQAAVHWTNQGMNRRQEAYQNEGVTILEVQDDKINFISDFFKDTEKF